MVKSQADCEWLQKELSKSCDWVTEWQMRFSASAKWWMDLRTRKRKTGVTSHTHWGSIILGIQWRMRQCNEQGWYALIRCMKCYPPLTKRCIHVYKEGRNWIVWSKDHKLNVYDVSLQSSDIFKLSTIAIHNTRLWQRHNLPRFATLICSGKRNLDLHWDLNKWNQTC